MDFIVWAVVWALVMLSVAAVAVYLIGRATQASIDAAAKAAGRALGRNEAARGSAARSPIVTEGRASLRIPPGAHVVRLVRRARPDDDRPGASTLAALATALADHGIDAKSIVDAVDEGGTLTLAYLQEGGAPLPARIREAAMGYGFAEPDARERPPFTAGDAQMALGRRATDRATANAEILRERLQLDRALEVVTAEMSTERPGDTNGLVTMAVRIAWRQSETAARALPRAGNDAEAPPAEAGDAARPASA